jgi:hypothetical protein
MDSCNRHEPCPPFHPFSDQPFLHAWGIGNETDGDGRKAEMMRFFFGISPDYPL